jgi:predicted RND superfamily exporter protein
MMTRLLTALARTTLERPTLVVLLSVLPALACAAYALTVPQNISFTGVMDRENPEVARYFDVTKRLELGGVLPILIEGPEERLDEAVAALVPALTALETVRAVHGEVPIAWLQANAPYLVDDAVFARWLKLATAPDDMENAKALEKDLRALQGEVERLQVKGFRVAQVTMRDDPFELEAGGGAYSEIERVTKETLARYGVTGEYTGLAAISGQDQDRTLGRISLLSPISLLLVLLLFRFLEASLVRIVVVAVPMLLAVGATLGLTGLITGVITLVESFFGVMIFGLGIDFAVHLMIRLREERARGLTFEDALVVTMTGSGRGVISGALTTAGAFGIVGLAPDPMAMHLGLSGALGIVTCLVLMLTLLPALWVLLERRGAKLQSRVDDVKLAPITFLARMSARSPFPVLGLSLAVIAVSIVGFSRFHFETNLERIFNRQVPAVVTGKRMQELFQINAGPWFVSAPSLDEARRVSQALRASSIVARVDSLADVMPGDPQARVAAIRAAQVEIEAQRKTYEGLMPVVGDDEAKQMREVTRLLVMLEEAGARPAPTIEDLPPVLRDRLRAPNGEFIIYAYVSEPTLDGYDAQKHRLAIQAIAPGATGGGALLEAIMATERPWAIPIFIGILLFVLALLILDFRDPRLVLLSLAPVVAATGVTFGLMCWANVSFNVLTTLVIPLIIGLGVDNGIHVVHRIKEDRTLSPDVAAASVGKAVVMTTLTTVISFGTLMFTDHAGMEGMALVILIGLPTSLLASVTTLPALARVIGIEARKPFA